MPSTTTNRIENVSYLNPTGFIINVTKVPALEFFAQEVTIPGIMCSNPEQHGRHNKWQNPSDELEYEPLSINFLIDEDMLTWRNLFKWMSGITSPEGYEQWKELVADETGQQPGTFKNVYSDIRLTVLTSHKNPAFVFTFKNCIPESLSGIGLSTTADSIIHPTATVTFKYSSYTVESA